MSTLSSEDSLSLSLESSPESSPESFITVKLQGFKFYRGTKTYRFPRFKTSYICGNNGTGKSSIYRAIQWAIFPKKNDKVHPFGTSKQVLVKVSFGSDLIITRTATPGTIQVTHAGTKYRGEDAESLIAKLFTSAKIYKMCVNRNTCVHPFIDATGPQRVELLNEMVGNKEALKKKLAGKFSKARAETDKADLAYTKERTRYKTLHRGQTLNESLILEDDMVERSNDSLTSLSKTVKLAESALKQLDTLKARKLQLTTALDRYNTFNRIELEELLEQRKRSNEYLPVEAKLTEVYSKLIAGLKDLAVIGNVPVLSEQDWNKVLVRENIYNQYSKKAKDLGLVYTESGINCKKNELEAWTRQEAESRQYYVYKTLESEVNKAKATVANLQSDMPLDYNALAEIARLELGLSYQPLWQKHQSLNELQARLRQAWVGEELSLDQVKSRVKALNETLSYEKTLILRTKYESKWAQISSKYPGDWYLTSKLPGQVRDRSEELATTLNAIKLSESMIKCPHCDGCVRIIQGKLVKCEGSIVKLDKKKLEEEIKALNDLSTLAYPTVPEVIKQVRMKDVETEKVKLVGVIDLLTQLKGYDDLEALPAGYVAPGTQARVRIKFLKLLVLELEKYSNLQAKLDGMECPVLKLDLTLADIAKAKVLLSELNKLVVVNQPEYTSEVYRLRADHAKLETKLSSLTKPSQAVTEQDIIKYTTCLQTKEQAQKDLVEVNSDIGKITWTGHKLNQVKQEITHLETQLDESTKQVTMLTNYYKLQTVKDKRRQKKLDLDHLDEFKRIFEKDCKACIINTLLSIQYTTNEFLEMLTDVRILLTMDNNIKIECIKDGFNCGGIKELSDGEASLVSFGLNIAFALQSDFDLLILDEVTDKLSSSNKDACIEILFDIMSKNKKTLILTDHHHHNGDYDNTIELGKK
jgi:energy-coupling factor transporter ATP-binding protein EcfA2